MTGEGIEMADKIQVFLINADRRYDNGIPEHENLLPIALNEAGKT